MSLRYPGRTVCDYGKCFLGDTMVMIVKGIIPSLNPLAAAPPGPAVPLSALAGGGRWDGGGGGLCAQLVTLQLAFASGTDWVPGTTPGPEPQLSACGHVVPVDSQSQSDPQSFSSVSMPFTGFT